MAVATRDCARVLGCEIDRLTMAQTVERCRQIVESGRTGQHVAVNVAKLVALQDDPRLREIVAGCDVISADGQPFVWASRLLRDPRRAPPSPRRSGRRDRTCSSSRSARRARSTGSPTTGRTLASPFLMGVGGTLDVIAGVARRAPAWARGAGLEWLFRLIQEPRRLWRRYLIANSRFAISIFSST